MDNTGSLDSLPFDDFLIWPTSQEADSLVRDSQGPNKNTSLGSHAELGSDAATCRRYVSLPRLDWTFNPVMRSARAGDQGRRPAYEGSGGSEGVFFRVGEG